MAFGLLTRGEASDAAYASARTWIERVGLARALAVDTGVVLMDEAFSALDPLIRLEMQDFPVSLQRSLRKTIVFVTRDLDEAISDGAGF